MKPELYILSRTATWAGIAANISVASHMIVSGYYHAV